MTLVRSAQTHDDDIDSLRSRLAELDAALAQRVEALARAKSNLRAFEIRYRQDLDPRTS